MATIESLDAIVEQIKEKIREGKEMTQETKTKKNTDYSASAVNLCNPASIEIKLNTLEQYNGQLLDLQGKMDACIPNELKSELSNVTACIAELNKQIREDIEASGSYQDLTLGWYAVKQRKTSKSSNAEPFEKNYPQFAPAVIVKAVDTTKLNGLIKGGLLDEARLEADGVLKITESFVYIIKV
jgi:small-conductance mechanosensitive channel